MKIRVTQGHIDRAVILAHGKFGTFGDKFNDPITLAIREELGANRCMTHPATAEVDGVFYMISQEAINFYNNWAQGVIGAPFSFTLTKRE